MKNRTGSISGFIIGLSGFLLLFKLMFLDRISPEDEIAPGIVMIAAVMNGLLFAFISFYVQNFFLKRKSYK